jgi:hypothetical protein
MFPSKQLTVYYVASVMKDEQGRPFIVVREYVSKGRNLSSNNTSKKVKHDLGDSLTASQSGKEEKAAWQ